MPFLVRWPAGIRAGTRVDAMGLNVDFAPTFLAAAGLAIPADMQGHSLLPLMRGRTPTNWRTSMYYRYYHDPGHHNTRAHYGVRTLTHKLIHFWKKDQWELFDLQKDPFELHNLYGQTGQERITTQLRRAGAAEALCGTRRIGERAVPTAWTERWRSCGADDALTAFALRFPLSAFRFPLLLLVWRTAGRSSPQRERDRDSGQRWPHSDSSSRHDARVEARQITQARRVGADRSHRRRRRGAAGERRKARSFLSLWGADVTRRSSASRSKVASQDPADLGYDVITGCARSSRSAGHARLRLHRGRPDGAGQRGGSERDGMHWTFAPMVDSRATHAGTHRRVPAKILLGSVMAARRARLPGRQLASPTALLATAKHFAAYGAAEAGRDYNIASVSSAICGTCTAAIHAAFARRGSLMASFNGSTASGAREEWLLTTCCARAGLSRSLVSDWTGVSELMQHGIAATVSPPLVARCAGVDMEKSSVLFRLPSRTTCARGGSRRRRSIAPCCGAGA